MPLTIKNGVAFTLVLLFLGCSSINSKLGDSAYAKGNYDDAISYYRAAVSSDPTNELTKTKLRDSLQKGANFHREKAISYYASSNYISAIQELEISINYVKNSESQNLLREIKNKKKIADAALKMNIASTEEIHGNLISAKNNFSQAMRLDPSNSKEAQSSINRINEKIEKANLLTSKARDHLVAGELEEARNLNEKAIFLFPYSSRSNDLQNKINNEFQATDLAKSAKSSLTLGDWDSAVSYINDALSLSESHSINVLNKEIKEKAFTAYMQLGDRYASSYDWKKASSNFSKAKLLKPNNKNTDNKLKESSYNYALNQASSLEHEKPKKALVHYKEAYAIRQNPDIKLRISALEEVSSEEASLSADQVYEKNIASVVIIKNHEGQGSGVIIADNMVLTNKHVVETSNTGQIITSSGKALSFYKVVRHRNADVALIHVMGLSDQGSQANLGLKMKPGQKVFAIGSPRGQNFSVSEGIVSYVGRSVNGIQMIQHTAAISPGSSGGPLYDESGKVVGLNTSYLTNGQNLNYATPTEYVLEFLSELKSQAKLN